MYVEIKTTEPVTVAFIRMQGEYSQIPDAIRALYIWTGMQAMQAAGAPSAVYYTKPQEGHQSSAEWEIWVPLTDDAELRPPDEKGRGVRSSPSKQVAVTIHTGPYETIADTYYALGAWIEEHGFQVAGPPEESYLSDPKDTRPEEYLTEIRFPVERAEPEPS